MSLFKCVLTVPVATLVFISGGLLSPTFRNLAEDSQTTSACPFRDSLNTRIEYDHNSTCHGQDFTSASRAVAFHLPGLAIFSLLVMICALRGAPTIDIQSFIHMGIFTS